jgi:hypothetical protein
MYAGIFRWVLVACDNGRELWELILVRNDNIKLRRRNKTSMLTLITCPYYLIVVYFYCIPRSQLFSVGQRPNKRSDDGRNEDGMMRLLAIGICWWRKNWQTRIQTRWPVECTGMIWRLDMVDEDVVDRVYQPWRKQAVRRWPYWGRESECGAAGGKKNPIVKWTERWLLRWRGIWRRDACLVVVASCCGGWCTLRLARLSKGLGDGTELWFMN